MNVTRVIWFALDYNFYFVLEDGNVVILILYVHDLIITKNNTSKINWIKEQFESRFEMTNLGKYKLYLGVEFLMTEKGIFMPQ